jgi:hypothetical protein
MMHHMLYAHNAQHIEYGIQHILRCYMHIARSVEHTAFEMYVDRTQYISYVICVSTNRLNFAAVSIQPPSTLIPCLEG